MRNPFGCGASIFGDEFPHLRMNASPYASRHPRGRTLPPVSFSITGAKLSQLRRKLRTSRRM
jgi:hypothetical protein